MIKFVSWNLEKRDLVEGALSSGVDVALFQEYNSAFSQDTKGYEKFEAISFDTFGTAIFSREKPVAVNSVKSPHADYRAQFWKGTINKNTAVATFRNGLTVVSFHGFNGTLQGRRPEMLIDHIDAVLRAIPAGPCVIGGDFNTFTSEHHEAVESIMTSHGFSRGIQVPYDAVKTLDLVYMRKCQVELTASGHHLSDHPFMMFNVTV